MLFGEHCLGGVEVYLAIGRQWHRVDFIAGELPRDDVAMMLEGGDKDAVASVLRERASDEIDCFGGAAGKDKFVFFPADEVRGCSARGLVTRGHARRAL